MNIENSGDFFLVDNTRIIEQKLRLSQIDGGARSFREDIQNGLQSTSFPN